MNEKFRNSLNRKPQSTPPVWMMRQAGRYHSHYQALKAKHTFMELCLQPELAAQVALGPIQDFDFDVSILFSDLLFPLQALGMGLDYTEKGPQLGWHLRHDNLKKLKPWDEALPELEFQRKALKATREILPPEKSLIGFVGGPWTLFGYAVEGTHAGSMVQTKKSVSLFPEFCKTLIPLLEGNIRLQLEGGAEVVMIFDTAAGDLSAEHFKELATPLLVQLAQKFPGRLGYYSKHTLKDFFSENLLGAPWAGFGFDHRWDLKNVLPWAKNGFVQGNFDQTLLHLPSDEFQKVFRRYLEPLKRLSNEERAGWVCGLGHGVLPQTPEANVRSFVEIVREVFK